MPSEQILKLERMSVADFTKYLDVAVSRYASEKMKAEGLSKEAANKLASESFHSLLPNGLQSENQNLFNVVNSQTNVNVGMIWYCKKSDQQKSWA